MDINNLPPYLRPKEAMYIARLSRNTLKARIRDGLIDAEPINERGDLRISTMSLLSFLGHDDTLHARAIDILRSLSA